VRSSWGLLERINRLEDALEARHKADAEREEREEQERQFDEEPLSLPPGMERTTENPADAVMNKVSAREIIARDETHTPGGELHALPPKEEGALPEPPMGTEDAGGVPLSYGNVPTSYVRGGPKDQAGDLPAELEQSLDLPEPPEPKGSVYPQPISVSLNEG
jgi:hypothetical protein